MPRNLRDILDSRAVGQSLGAWLERNGTTIAWITFAAGTYGLTVLPVLLYRA